MVEIPSAALRAQLGAAGGRVPVAGDERPRAVHVRRRPSGGCGVPAAGSVAAGAARPGRAVAEAAKAEGKSCGVCGEAASDPLLACVLTGLGVTSCPWARRRFLCPGDAGGSRWRSASGRGGRPGGGQRRGGAERRSGGAVRRVGPGGSATCRCRCGVLTLPVGRPALRQQWCPGGECGRLRGRAVRSSRRWIPGDEVAGLDVRAVGVEDLTGGEGFEPYPRRRQPWMRSGPLVGLMRMTSPPGLWVARPRARTPVNSRASASSMCGVPPMSSSAWRTERRVSGEPVTLHTRCRSPGGAVSRTRRRRRRSPGEGGSAGVLAAGGAAAEAGEQGWRRTPRWPGGRLRRREPGGGRRGLALVRHGRSAGGEFGGEPGAAGGGVGVEDPRPSRSRRILRVEEGDGGVGALCRACPEQGFHLVEIGGVVVEGEAAVAPHGAEVVFVGEQSDGAGDFPAQDASRGLVGVRHVSPCARVDQCSLTVTGGTDNGVG